MTLNLPIVYIFEFSLGSVWPDYLNCDNFPVHSTDGKLCFGPSESDDVFDTNRCKTNVGFTCPDYMQVPKEHGENVFF